jgi:heme A synthase
VAVIAQGLLGGARVLLLEYRFPAAMTHAFLAQFFFCLTVSLATFTSPQRSPVDQKAQAGALRPLSAVAVVALFIQLLLGAAFRHRGLGITPHLVGAVIVTIVISWVSMSVLKLGRRAPVVRPRLNRLAVWAIAALVVQLILGVAAYYARLASQNDPQPLPPMVYLTVAHVACGALVLAIVLTLALRVFQISAPPGPVAEFRPRAERATS